MGIMLGSDNAKQIKIVFHQSATHVDFIFEVYKNKNKCKNKTKQRRSFIHHSAFFTAFRSRPKDQ